MTISGGTSKNRLLRSLGVVAASSGLVLAGITVATPATAASSTIVIDEVYGGGGNSGAPLANDFIELRNIGTAPVSLDGWSVSYASASTGNVGGTTKLDGATIAPGADFLIQEAGSGTAAALPTPDATGTINLSASSGSVTLLNGTTVVDLVGYGSGAKLQSETAPAPGLSNTTADARDSAGTDTDDNAADFTAGAPTTTNAAASDYGTVMVTVKGQEIPAIMSMAAENTSVFQPQDSSVTFTIEATGGYVLKLANPPSISGAVAAPQTFKGSAGTVVTPVVRTKGTYVMLSLKYLGTPNEDAPSGAMLATAQIYDAVTGDSVLNVPKYVNKAKIEDSDGNTRPKPGTYFLIVTGASAEDTWEASITEG